MQFTSTIADFSTPELRNLIRGAIANTNRRVQFSTLNRARRVLKLRDASPFTHLLLSANLDELYYGPAFPSGPHSLYRNNSRRTVHVSTEAAIQACRLKQQLPSLMKPAADLGRINTALISNDLTEACHLCERFAENYGFSATLARKATLIYSRARALAPNRSAMTEDDPAYSLLSKFVHVDQTPLYSQYLNLVLDILDQDAPTFDILREHRRILAQLAQTLDPASPYFALMRRLLYPTNYNSIIDSSGLLFLSSSSAIDLLVDTCVASHCNTPQPSFLAELFSLPHFLRARSNLQPRKGALRAFLRASHNRDTGEALYKASFACSEVKELGLWRRAIDYELHFRDHAQCDQEPPPYKYFSSKLSLSTLCHGQKQQLKSLSRFENATADIFLRTIAVLACLRNGGELSALQAVEIRGLLSVTTALSRLLTEQELLALKAKAVRDESTIILFLTLVMLNEKQPSEDQEFEVRRAFQALLLKDFRGDFFVFLDWLHGRTPGLSHVVVDLCDITFLERLYLLHSSYAEVLASRQLICK